MMAAFFIGKDPMHQDRHVRKYAVPVRGTIWGMNHTDTTERDIGKRPFEQGTYSDYNDFFPGVDYDGTTISPRTGASKICPMRILQPHYGGIAECFADLQITVAAADSDLTLKLAVGRLQPGTYDRVSTYTDDEINASWRKIRGTDTPLSVSGGVIAADIIDLLPALPKYGDANFIEDAFVLIVAFNKVPTLTGTFKFNFLNLHMSVTGVV